MHGEQGSAKDHARPDNLLDKPINDNPAGPDQQPRRQVDPYAELGDVSLLVECELGRKQLSLAAVARFKEQDVIDLDKLAGEAVDVRINGMPFAEGEIVVAEDQMAVRVTRLIDRF